MKAIVTFSTESAFFKDSAHKNPPTKNMTPLSY